MELDESTLPPRAQALLRSGSPAHKKSFSAAGRQRVRDAGAEAYPALSFERCAGTHRHLRTPPPRRASSSARLSCSRSLATPALLRAESPESGDRAAVSRIPEEKVAEGRQKRARKVQIAQGAPKSTHSTTVRKAGRTGEAPFCYCSTSPSHWQLLLLIIKIVLS